MNSLYRFAHLAKLKAYILFLVAVAFSIPVVAQPLITSFTPKSGVVGTLVTINGQNFSPVATENVVYFGRVRAVVNSVTTTSLKVTVPVRATDHVITVTSKGRTAFSSQPFTIISGGALTPTSFPTRWGFGVTGNYPSGLLVDDWNDDGKSDLLAANFNSGNLSLFQSDAYASVVQVKSEVKFATGRTPEGLAFGDVDSDGKPDVVATSIDDRLFSVFRNTSAPGGTITFNSRIDFPAGDYNNAPRGVALGDLDGDGKADIVLAGNNKWVSANGSFGSLAIHRNTSQNGGISFSAETSLETGDYPRKVVLADLDGDGKSDLATNNQESGTVTIYRNTSIRGKISFTNRTDYPLGATTDQLTVADLNNDGKPELVVSSLVTSQLFIIKNNSTPGTFSFGVKQSLAITNPLGVDIGDLSGDGKPELAVASFSTHKISVFPNNSSGSTISFLPKMDYNSGNNPVEVSIGDVDGDGYPDLALTNSTSNFISVMKMEPGSPTLNLGTDQRLCQGDSTQLRVNLPNASFLWSTGATTSSITVKQPGSYWVKANVGGVTLTDTVNILFSSLPALQLGGDTTLCMGQQLLLQPGITGATYTWQDGSTGQAQLVSQPGKYWLLVEKDGCATADTIQINYKPLPHLSLGSDTAFCMGTSLLLSAADPSIESYYWYNGNQGPEIQLTSGGKIWVRAQGWNGCFLSDTIQVKELAHFTLGKDTVLCEGAVQAYQFSLLNASYLWSDGSAGSGITIKKPGLYWLEVTEGKCTHRDSIQVAFQAPPQIDLGADTLLCEGVQKVLNAYTPQATYLWNTGSTLPTYTVQKTGTFTVRVSLNGCVVSDSVQVSYIPLPRVDLGTDTLLCMGQNLLLTANGNNATYIWQDGSTASSFMVRTPGRYQVTVANSCGVARDEIVVTEGPCTVSMPNAFTPNGDGKNDLFRVKYPAFIQTFRMEVYDRWGERIFVTTDPYKGWDGTIKNVLAPSGSYVWTMVLTDKKDEKQSYSGTVVLIR